MESQENNKIYLVCLFLKFAKQWDLSTFVVRKDQKGGEKKAEQLNTQMTNRLGLPDIAFS